METWAKQGWDRHPNFHDPRITMFNNIGFTEQNILLAPSDHDKRHLESQGCAEC